MNETSALVLEKSQAADGGTGVTPGYASGNDDLDFDFETTSKSTLSAESDF